MKRLKFKVALFSAFFLPLALHPIASAATLYHEEVTNPNNELLLDILKLALSKSAPDMVFTTVQGSQDYTQTRKVAEIEAKNISVMWVGTTPEYETILKPVRIPAMKGMLGHRIFIIKQGNQSMFDNIRSLSDLKQLNAGQGTNWGDTAALKNSGIPVVTTMRYHNLFPMLEGERFDYFPRAIHEPWREVSDRAELLLTVEQKIILVYPFAMYFFVGLDNQTLHDQIYSGMEMAISDGSFDKLFFSHPLVKDAIDRSKLGGRTVIRIPNPGMGPETPFNRKEFWLDLGKL